MRHIKAQGMTTHNYKVTLYESYCVHPEKFKKEI